MRRSFICSIYLFIFYTNALLFRLPSQDCSIRMRTYTGASQNCSNNHFALDIRCHQRLKAATNVSMTPWRVFIVWVSSFAICFLNARRTLSFISSSPRLRYHRKARLCAFCAAISNLVLSWDIRYKCTFMYPNLQASYRCLGCHSNSLLCLGSFSHFPFSFPAAIVAILCILVNEIYCEDAHISLSARTRTQTKNSSTPY